MAKCILLVRVSTQHQDLTSQTEKVKAEALKDGYAPKDIIILEDKESAIKLSEEERNGLNRMKDHIEHDDISCVYTYEVSRISRQPAMLYNIRDYLIEHHVQLIILNPYMKMLDDEGRLSPTANVFFSIFTGLAENEMYLRNQRIARGFERKRKSLEHAGGQVPFGYSLDKNHHYIVNEEEAKFVRRMYQEYADGLSLKTVCKRLQDEGFKADKSKYSLVRMMFRMLHKEYYAGDWKHPAIVSKELYERVQNKCETQRTYWGENVRTALLKGIIISKGSGRIMGARFRCNQYICNTTRIHSCKMDIADMIAGGVAREWYNEIYVYRKDEYIKNINDQISHWQKVKSQQEKNITNNQNKIDRIEDRYIEGRITKERANEMEEKAFQEMNRYKKLYYQSVSEIERLNEEKSKDRMMVNDLRTIIVDMISRVVFERINKATYKFYIFNKHTGEQRILTVRAHNGEILNSEIILRPNLNYLG